MPDNYDFIQSCLDQFQFITVNGKALDLDLNEYRDENGQIVYVPIEFRSLFKTVELSEWALKQNTALTFIGVPNKVFRRLALTPGFHPLSLGDYSNDYLQWFAAG